MRMMKFNFGLLSIFLGFTFFNSPLHAAMAPCVSATRGIIQSTFHPQDVKKIKVALFDADSTLRIAPSGSVSANGPTDVRLLPFMSPRLKQLEQEGFLIYIVSNQRGIGSHMVSCADADAALNYTTKLIRDEGGAMHGYDFAEFADENAKPNVGMGKRLEARLKATFGPDAEIDKAHSLMVGDSAYKVGVDLTPQGMPGTDFSDADRLFAENFGVPFKEAAIFFGWRDFGIDAFTTVKAVEDFEKFCKADPDCLKKLIVPCNLLIK